MTSHTTCSHAAADIAVSVRDLRVTLGGQPVLRGVNISVQRGEFVSIIGQSGSGKSTLLSLMAGLDVPSQGTVRLLNQDLFALDDDGRAVVRGRNMGFVFQSFAVGII